MTRTVLIITLVSHAFRIAAEPPPPSVTALPEHKGYATQFTKGAFVKDVRSPYKADTADLRELALTLPILEANEPDRLVEQIEFIYRASKPALTEDSWRLLSDGAQAPVLIERLPRSPAGAQRIQVTITPLPRGVPLKAFRYVSQLERREGGWLILKATKTQTVGKKEEAD